MSYGQYVYMLIYFSIDINALRAILLKSAIVNRCSQIIFFIVFNHKGTKKKGECLYFIRLFINLISLMH